MMNEIAVRVFCRQYRVLEKEMVDIADYISIDPSNYSTFSAKLLMLYLAVCSEVDSVADAFCKDLGVGAKERYGINNKMNCILNVYGNLRNWKCTTKRLYGTISLVPFAKFTDTESADWWKAYNQVKHSRTEKCTENMYNYQLANLKNVMSALAALYLLLYKIDAEDAAGADTVLDSALFDIDTAALK